MNVLTFSLISAALALAYAGLLWWRVARAEKGNEKMESISLAIRQASFAYLKQQYKVIAVFGVVITVVLWWLINWQTGIGFAVGAVLSALAGYLSMANATIANVKTAQIAKQGLARALGLSFQGGAVTGFVVVGLGLLGVTAFYAWFRDPSLLIGFGFGASLISLFARVGGGIYTKAADVGADLVGKVEAGIPEDDPRNPAVIADNSGDNVGDGTNTAADLFETFVVTTIAAMLLGVNIENGVVYPLILGAIGVLASIIGTYFVKLRGKNIMGAFYVGTFVTAVLSAIAYYFVTREYLGDIRIFWAGVVGLIVTIGMTIITEYFTSTKYTPVRSIANASKTGAGTNIISGLAWGFRSTWMPVVLIVAAILGAYALAGVYGIAIAAVAMLSTTGMVIAIDAFGPITDNAGGIAEMANLPKEVREVTDALDAVGNTTKAVTKGYAIGSAALASLALFVAYYQEVVRLSPDGWVDLSLSNVYVVVGLFIGALLPFLFSSFLMQAVGNAAFKVVENVRHQFKTKKILEGIDKPDYKQTALIVTSAAQKEMALPAILSIAIPLAVGFILGPAALGGLLAGAIVSGLMIAILMTTGGAAWDNAKKYIEEGNHGGKKSDAHIAAVVGDTVGDPFKDTAGPAINALIKVINTIALIFLGLIVLYHVWG